jgi:hypothetical protein
MIRFLALLSLSFTLAFTSSATAQNAATPRPDPIAILAAAKAASGGTAWDALRTQHSSVSIGTSGVKGTAERWSDIYTGRSLIKYNVGPVSGAAGYDGKVAWSQDASGQSRAESSDAARELAVNAAYRDKLAFWFPDRAKGQISFMDRVAEDGAVFDVVRILPEGGRPFQFWINSETHLIERLVEREAQETRTEYFMDLRDVEGVKVPYRVRATRGDPRNDEVITVDKLDYNWPLAGIVFAQPATARPDFALAAGRSSIEVPFEVRDGHIFITVALNGKGPFRMLLDADRGNVLAPQAMAALGVQSQGNFGTAGAGDDQREVGVARIEQFDLGGVVSTECASRPSDVTAFMARVEGIDNVSGVVGYELFKRFPIKLDYQRARATFYDPSKFTYTGDGVAVPVKLRGRVLEVEGSVDGFKGTFSIDTSGRGSLALAAPFADKNGFVKRYGATQSFVSGASEDGYLRSLLARANAMKLGSVEIAKPVVALSTQAGPLRRPGTSPAASAMASCASSTLRSILPTRRCISRRTRTSARPTHSIGPACGSNAARTAEVIDVIKDGPQPRRASSRAMSSSPSTAGPGRRYRCPPSGRT